MKLIIPLLLLCLTSFGQTTPLTFTPISASSDIRSPGRGAEQWNQSPWDNVNDPYIPAANSIPYSWYRRFLWAADFEDVTQGVYDFTVFDAQIDLCIDRGQLFSFGLMPMCTGCINRAWTYPTYLHNLMQAEAVGSRDWLNSFGWWVPNWNSPNYLARWAALCNAVAAHIQAGSHAGKNYRDAIGYVDIRGYGETGEWNTYPWYTDPEPAGRKATSTSLNSIVDAVVAAFPNNQLVICFGSLDPGNASLTPPATSSYILTKSNNYGRIGWRRDNMGNPGFDAALDGQPGILTQWAFAPIGGEPNNDANDAPYGDVPREVTKYKMSYFGNGNWSNVNASNATFVANARQASLNSGYRIVLNGGSNTTNPTTGGAFNISLAWKNIGVAPVYDRRWKIIYELRKTSDQSVGWRDTSDFSLRLFLPQVTDSTFTDTYLLTGVTATTYNLHLLIVDSTSYTVPFPLAILGRQGDGSYILRSNITVTTSGSPTANAGADQSITLPTSSVTLNASLSSGATTYLWTRISGPNTPTITTPAAVSTTVTGLIAGTYVFQVSVNSGASTDQATIVVNPAPVAPVANAGAGQNITLPVNYAVLNGSGSTGSITSYLWTNISGPNVPNLITPTAVSTNVTNMIAGTYVFQLSVTGGSTSQTQIIVNPQASNGTTIFTTQVPLGGTIDNFAALELGVIFQSTQAGYITGVRFYRQAGNNGTHIGELYTSTGTRLAQATFANETATGWQTASFATPIPITANTTYVAAYFNPSGVYSGTTDYFTTPVMNSPLIALASPNNGVYIVTGTPAFPTSVCGGCNSPNYWVDVVFSPTNPNTKPKRRAFPIYFRTVP